MTSAVQVTGGVNTMFKYAVLSVLISNVLNEKASTHSKTFTFGFTETYATAPLLEIADVETKKAIQRVLRGEFTYTEVAHFLDAILAEDVTEGYLASSWEMVRRIFESRELASVLDVTLYSPKAEVVKAFKDLDDSKKENVFLDVKDGLKHFKEKSLYRTDFVLIEPDYSNNTVKTLVDVGKSISYLSEKNIAYLAVVPVTKVSGKHLAKWSKEGKHGFVLTSKKEGVDSVALVYGNVDRMSYGGDGNFAEELDDVFGSSVRGSEIKVTLLKDYIEIGGN